MLHFGRRLRMFLLLRRSPVRQIFNRSWPPQQPVLIPWMMPSRRHNLSPRSRFLTKADEVNQGVEFLALYKLLSDASQQNVADIEAQVREVVCRRAVKQGEVMDFAEPFWRARSVELYYLVRNPSTTPAEILGGFLWHLAPPTPLVTASFIGLIGTIVFAVTVEERYAG